MIRNTSVWRLDVIRHQAFWQGSQFLEAKAELYRWLLQGPLAKEALSVNVITDTETYDRFYEVWLDELNINLAQTTHFLEFTVLDIEREDDYLILDELMRVDKKEMKQLRLNHGKKWRHHAEKLLFETIDQAGYEQQQFLPEWLEKHLRPESDVIQRKV